MDRSRNPYDLQQVGSRLRLTSNITGLVIEADVRNRQECRTAANLMQAHHAALCGVQDACGLHSNATVEARKRQYDQWHYAIYAEPQTAFSENQHESENDYARSI